MPSQPMRILFLCPRHPYPPLRGDQVRAAHLIESFARRAEVSVLCFGERAESPTPGEVPIRTVAPSPTGRVRANLRHPGPRLPAQVRMYLDAAMERAVAEEVERFEPTVLHVVLARMGPYMSIGGPEIHRHIDLTDSLSLNMATRARRTKGVGKPVFALEARLMQRYEAKLAALAGSASVVSAADREVPGLSGVAVVPNGVDVDAFPFEEPTERPPAALFFGNLGYFHNAETATYLARCVAPLLRREDPAARLEIVGARPGRAVRQLAELEGVGVTADVESMVAQLHGAAVAVLPSFSGSGIKNKVLEAFSAGLPVVSNRLGMQGVEGAQAGTHYLLAEGPEEMAAAARRLIGDAEVRKRIAAEAVELVRHRYAWDAQADALERLYAQGPA